MKKPTDWDYDPYWEYGDPKFDSTKDNSGFNLPDPSKSPGAFLLAAILSYGALILATLVLAVIIFGAPEAIRWLQSL